MLDEKDLQAIAALISESEQRMVGKITESEQRMVGKITESEQRIKNETMVMMESYFDPKFNLLSEKIDVLEEKLVPKSRVEALEDEMAFMKTVVSAMSKEIQELKKAQ